MKLIVERTHLLAALKAVAHLADGKAKIPVLGHVRLRTEGARLFIAATDLDAWAEADTPAEVERQGDVALPAPQLLRMVQGFGEGAQVSVDVGETKARVRSGRSAYEMAVWPAGDFPPLFGAGDHPACFSLRPDEIERLFEVPKPGASKDQPDRPFFEGIFLHGPIEGGTRDLRGVGCDGTMLMAAHIELPPGAAALPLGKGGWPSVVVPLKAVDHLIKLGSAGLDLEIGANVLTAHASGAMNVAYATKLLSNDFPDYRPIIPASEGPHVEVDGGAFAAAVQRLSGLAGDDKRAIGIEWGEDGDLSLWLDDAALVPVDGAERVESASLTGTARTGLLAAHLAKMVAAIGHGRLEIYSSGPGKIVRLRNMDDPDLIACIAPCALRRRSA